MLRLSEVSVAKILELLGPRDARALSISETDSIFNCALSTSSTSSEGASIFVAIPGARYDGHDFVEQAFRNGAVLAVVNREAALKGRPGVVVPDTRRALSHLALFFSGNASEALTNVAITGTNGKTTINWLVHESLKALNKRSLRIGTLGTEFLGTGVEGNLTTPDALSLHELFKDAVGSGVKYCVLEASSHALSQKRIADVAFDVAVFSNLTRDHLDYHKSMEEYYQAKLELFKLLARQGPRLKAAVVNIDSAEGARIVVDTSALKIDFLTYGFSETALLCISEFKQSFEGLNFTLSIQGKKFEVMAPFIGRHNAYNISATVGVLLALGISPDLAIATVAKLPQVPGRLEAVGSANFGVYVDYAHSPDALMHVLKCLAELKKGKLWVIFGCGGDRDKGKRVIMAEVADRFADSVVVTSDNPRTEDPASIITDILSSGIKPKMVEPDRRKAIEFTLRAAKAGDVVLIAGKGHENYQIIGETKYHFSDAEEAQRVLQELA